MLGLPLSRRHLLLSGLIGLGACVPTPEEMLLGAEPEPGPAPGTADHIAAAYRDDLDEMRLVAAHADHAVLAWLAYADARRDGAKLPPGWRLVRSREERFRNFGDLAIRLFRGPGGQVVLAFRGTDDWQDWVTDNASSVLQFPTPMLERTAEIARETKAAHPGVVFVGHSLGGRLAIIASISTGNEAVVFDSAFPSLSDTFVRRVVRRGQAPKFTAFSSPFDPVSGFTAYDGITVRNYPKFRTERRAGGPGARDAAALVLHYHDPGLLAQAMQEVKRHLPEIEAAAGA